MTDRLQEIRARLDAATPGPWERWKDGMRIWSRSRPDAQFGVDVADVYASGATADLIAHAPADLAWLLGERERMRSAIACLAEYAADSHGSGGAESVLDELGFTLDELGMTNG